MQDLLSLRAASPHSHTMRVAGAVVSFLWAGFWLWFGFASAFGEQLGAMNFVSHLFPGLLFLGVALIAWRWSKAGIRVLCGIAAFCALAYPMVFSSMTTPVILLALAFMSGPPLIAALFYALAREEK